MESYINLPGYTFAWHFRGRDFY